MSSRSRIKIMIQEKDKKVKLGQLKGGDIVLCHQGSKKDLVGKKIESVTGSSYKHARLVMNCSQSLQSKRLLNRT